MLICNFRNIHRQLTTHNLQLTTDNSQLTTMVPIRSALVSFGISSKTFHAPFLTTMPEFELLAVVERNSEHSKEKYPWVTVYKNIEELLKDDRIELVVITSPNETHFPYARM